MHVCYLICNIEFTLFRMMRNILCLKSGMALFLYNLILNPVANIEKKLYLCDCVNEKNHFNPLNKK